MRKIISSILIIAVMVCQMSIPALAADDGLIFELDLSACTASSMTVKNKVTNSASGITLGSSTESGSSGTGPILKEFENAEGGTTKYLCFTNPENNAAAGTYGVLDLTGDAVSAMENQDELTMEFWLNTNKGNGSVKSGRLFQWTKGSTVLMENYINGSTEQFQWRPFVGADSEMKVGISSQVDSWHHYVLTRKWNTTTSKYDISLYCDGAYSTNAGGTVLNNVSYGSQATETDSKLTLGGRNYGTGNVYGGSIGAFRVYNKVLSASEIANKYNTEKTAYAVPLDPIMVDEDFEDYALTADSASFVPSAESDLFIQANNTVGSGEGMKIKQATADGQTKKYLEVVCPARKDSFVGAYFTPSCEVDAVLELNIKIEGQLGGAGSRDIRFGGTTNASTVQDIRNSLPAQTDAFGFANLQYTFIKGSDGKYDMKCYDLLDNKALIASKDDLASSFSHIVCQQYYDPGAVTGTYSFNISKFKLYMHTTPEILNSNVSGLERADDTITLMFTEAIDDNTLNDESILLTNVTTGKTVKTEVSGYNSGNRTVSVKLLEYLDYSNSYEITFDGITNLNGFEIKDSVKVPFTMGAADIVVDDVTFKNNSGSSITSLGTNQNISVDVDVTKDSGEAATIGVFLLLCDANGIVTDIAYGEEDLLAATTTDTISAALTGNVTVKTGYSAKCYVWQTLISGEQRVILATPAELN